MKRLLVVLLLIGLAASLAALWAVKELMARRDLERHGGGAALAPLYPAPAFSFPSQTGQVVTRESLAGHVWVADFVFTTCRTVCPSLTVKMVRLQRELPSPNLRFVSFSVDPAHDTPEALAAYAKRWNADEPRWLLLSTTPAGLASVAQGFHVVAERQDGGVDPIMHSAMFLLVDGAGQVRGVYDSDDPDAFAALREGVLALSGTQLAARKAGRSGEELFHELSCVRCHEDPNLAPPLGGLLGKSRELDTRLRVQADESYIRESILAPDAKRVAGYPLKMPSYAGHVTNGELDALVRYIKALPTLPPAGEDAKVAEDPFCHMKVRVAADTISVKRGGETLYFCSAYCRDHFLASSDPADAGR